MEYQRLKKYYQKMCDFMRGLYDMREIDKGSAPDELFRTIADARWDRAVRSVASIDDATGMPGAITRGARQLDFDFAR